MQPVFRRGLAELLKAALLAALLFVLGTAARADNAKPLKGMALVIGQSNYEHVPALTNPALDAEAMRKLFDSWQKEGADAQQEKISALRNAVQAYPVIPLLKARSLTSCPWDLIEFGGKAQYVSHWLRGVTDGGPGRCFPSGHASVLAYTMPLWVALIGFVAFGQRLTGRLLAAILIGAAAVAALMAPNFVSYAKAPLGLFWGLFAGFCWAIGTFVVKRTSWSGMGLSLTFWQVLISLPPVLIGAMIFDGLPTHWPSAKALIATIYTGAIYYAMAVGHSEVDAGGTHEALIGVGYTVGPACGLVAGGLEEVPHRSGGRGRPCAETRFQRRLSSRFPGVCLREVGRDEVVDCDPV